MKTHITIEQLNSLSEFGRENLWRYFEPKFLDEYSTLNQDEKRKMGNIMMGKVLPLLDILTMIEYLGDKWVTYLRKMDGSFPSNDRICDELWEVIKELLED